MTFAETSQKPSLIQRPDSYIALSCVILGGGVIAYSLAMPTLGDGRPGPGLFPGIIGAMFVLLGLSLGARTVILARGAEGQSYRASLTQPREADGTYSVAPGHEPEVAKVPTMRRWMNGIVVLAAVAGYIVLAESLGFILTMFVIVMAICVLLKSKIIAAFVTALILSFGLWAVFELGLFVQLPDGLLW